MRCPVSDMRTERAEVEQALTRDACEHAIRMAVIADGFGERLGISVDEFLAAYRAAMEE